MFNKTVYIKRREALCKSIKSGLLILLGNDEVGMNYTDNTYHFRQDSTFSYFTGLNRPGLAAVIDVETGVTQLFGDDYTVEDTVWMGQQKSISSMCEGVGIEKTDKFQSLESLLKRAKDTGRTLHYLPPYRAEHKIKLSHLLGVHLDQVDKNSSVEFIRGVVNLRNYKSAEEIVEIEKACNITADMHISAMRYCKPGMMEAEVAAEMQRIAIAGGGNISFPTIATKRGETLHNHYHGNRLKEGDLMLIDGGAETELLYAGDMSSTFPVSKTFTTKQREIYQIALNAHNSAIEALKPGVPFIDIHKRACREIVKGLKDMGFMKGDIDEAVEAGAHALFFPCGLGHMMGLDVHDMENFGEVWVGYNGKPKSTLFGYKSLRLGRELEENFVLTIEPGIYFIPGLIDLWRGEKKFEQFLNYDKINSYRDFGGCRNEEDFLITADGARLLGKPIPKSVADVERMRE